MKNAKADHREHWLLLKSTGCMILSAAAFLLLLRHAAPVEEEDKFFGGGVSLLLARTPGEIKAFRRWTELNDPSHIFGFSSIGVFSRAVGREEKVELPSVRIYSPESMESALFLPAAQKAMPLEMETNSAGSPVIREKLPVEKRGLALKGMPVFDESGEIAAVLENIPETKKVNALLLRAGNNAAGVDFRIIESSGDRNFDRSVVQALERSAGRGKTFSGVLAVWPDPKEKGRK